MSDAKFMSLMDLGVPGPRSGARGRNRRDNL